jgi:SEC-C motif-containing protein
MDKEQPMEDCPCGSGKTYNECCEPLITNKKKAETAEALMRSRYTAFVKAEIDYVLQTIHPEKRDQHDTKTIASWATKSDWTRFELRDTIAGGMDDDQGQVEFIAHYRRKGVKEIHHELAQFKKVEGEWFFYDGEAPRLTQFVRETPKVGRNEPCPCGSGKKYKKCCGA